LKSQHLLANYLKSNWYYYLLAVIIIAAANIIQSYYPKVLGIFTDELQHGGFTRALVIRTSLTLLGIGLSFGVLLGVGQYIIMRLGRVFEFNTRRKLFKHFTHLGASFYANNGVGKMLSYVMNDVTSVRESISMGINQTTNATILIVSAIAMMIISSIPLYLIFVCILPLLVIPWVVIIFKPIILKRSLKVQESLAKMTESAEEQFGGIRVTKKFAVEPIMINRFGATVDQIRENQLSLVKMSAVFQTVLPFLGAVSLITTIIFGGYLTIKGKITLGDFVSLTLYMRMMINPLQQIGNVINTMQKSRASLDRINNLLSMQYEIMELKEAKSIHSDSAEIRIQHLSFTYPNSSGEALSDISLTVKPGKTLGIVGKTGSGKTTLIKLLLRIYDPPVGTIWIGDKDIREITLEGLRVNIAYVPQDGFLFSTTIRDNIAFFNRDSVLSAVEQAAKQANIYANIMEFPQKFEMRLGERGITLSGGQQQRTSLARGLIKNAPIMILDDSVSAVDAITETNIMESIRKERKDKTTVFIAHRVSTVKHADEIIVLDEGRIVQRGTHEQLLAEPGTYASLNTIQEEGTHYVEAE